MTIGERIQMLRKNNGLSQEDLAKKLLVSRQTVSQWETDQTIPSVDNIYRLKEILNVSFDELMSDEKTEREETEEEKLLEEYEYTSDEDEIKATVNFLYKFDIKQSFVIIGLMFLLGVCGAIMEAGKEFVSFIAGIILFFAVGTAVVAVTNKIVKRNQIKSMTHKSQNFRLFNDRLEMSFLSENGGKSEYVIRKEDIKKFFENEKYYAFIAGQMLFSIKKEVLSENSILRNFIYKEEIKESKKSKILSTTLFVLTIILGICLVFFFAEISALYDLIDNLVGWLLLVSLPVPLISAVYGLYKTFKKYDGTKNIIASVFVIVLICLCVRGIADYQYATYDDLDMVEYWNEMTDLDIPIDGEATNIFYDENGYYSEKGCYSSSTVVYKGEVAKAFEEQIAKDERWEKECPEELREYMLDFEFDTDGEDYYCLYNSDTEQFSEAPEKSGEYNFYLFVYNADACVLQVEDYIIEVNVG
ncbi:MAG: helix-turn-helix transcriptional regulator [Ruminococcaceae bacterium]|nr:helix-turn-helix transcriptional regulator [Oscillospiraceae bacterium]